MKFRRRRIRTWIAGMAMALAGVAVLAQTPTPIPEVIKSLGPEGGPVKEPGREWTLHGVVGARFVLPDSRAVALILNAGEPALQVFAASPAAMVDLVPRNEVTLSGKAGDGPLGAGLELKAGSVSIAATNKAFGASEPRGAEFLKDASALQGRYVQITNVTFVDTRFDASGLARVKASDGAEAVIRVSKSAAGREVPAGSQDVFGIPWKTAEGWQLIASRFLTVERRDLMALATKHTCITCHNPDIKLIGPAYRDVAAKYRDDPEAAGKLVAQMRTGGSGKWGPIPMIPFEGKVPPGEMQRLASWILGYQWDAVLAE